jgi:hypothetical protein
VDLQHISPGGRRDFSPNRRILLPTAAWVILQFLIKFGLVSRRFSTFECIVNLKSASNPVQNVLLSIPSPRKIREVNFIEYI